jgi:hypothetical protein
MGAPPGYRIERMPFAEVETAIHWAARKGWNPGLTTRRLSTRSIPRAFMGVLDGKPIARMSMPIYDDLLRSLHRRSRLAWAWL